MIVFLFLFQGDVGPAGPRGFPGTKGDRVSIKLLLILIIIIIIKIFTQGTHVTIKCSSLWPCSGDPAAILNTT